MQCVEAPFYKPTILRSADDSTSLLFSKNYEFPNHSSYGVHGTTQMLEELSILPSNANTDFCERFLKV